MAIESQPKSETGANAAFVQQFATDIRDLVQQVIVGKSETIDIAVLALLCRGHVLLEDVPGTGKTTLAKALASSLDCGFGRIQFGHSELSGYMSHSAALREGARAATQVMEQINDRA